MWLCSLSSKMRQETRESVRSFHYLIPKLYYILFKHVKYTISGLLRHSSGFLCISISITSTIRLRYTMWSRVPTWGHRARTLRERKASRAVLRGSPRAVSRDTWFTFVVYEFMTINVTLIHSLIHLLHSFVSRITFTIWICIII